MFVLLLQYLQYGRVFLMFNARTPSNEKEARSNSSYHT